MNIRPNQLGVAFGSGTVADLFRVTDSGKSVCVKKLHDSWASDAGIAQRFREAFIRSGQIRNRRFFATIYAAQQIDGVTYLAREYVQGESLAQASRPLPWLKADVKRLALALCDALRALHLQNMVHGGLHPGNIIVEPSGYPKLTDDGLSKAILTNVLDAPYSLDALRYLAPEQIQKRPVTPATDIYTLALIVNWLTTGQTVVGGSTLDSIRSSIRAGVTAAIAPLAKALQLAPTARYTKIEDFREALVAWFETLPESAAAPPVEPTPPPVAPPPPATKLPVPKETPKPGSLARLWDLKNNTNLLLLNHAQPWQLRRTGSAQQWPIFLQNGGPGELEITCRCVGDGFTLTPRTTVRIPPQQTRYLIVTLAARGSDWGRLDFTWPDQTSRQRVQVRVYRPA